MSKKEKVPESVLRCVTALRSAKSDNDRFASLFVVTKLIKADECDHHSLKLLYDAIGFNFLNRLLKSTEVPQDCPPFIYKSIALSIVSCFCGVPEIVESDSILSIIPVLLDIVSTSDTEDMEDNLMLVSDCYTCIQAIAFFESGRKALLSQGCLLKLTEVYVEEMFRHDQALQLLVYISSKEGKHVWDGHEEAFKQLVKRLANDFNSDTTEKKFELCKMLAVFLSNGPRLPVVELQKEDWPQHTLLTLESILCSRIGTSQRDSALQLIARLLEMMGIGWGLKFGPNPRQFLLLLVNLACVEVRMKLEDRTLEQAIESADILVACYSVVELFITFMTSQGFLDFDAKQREQAYCALKGAVGSILAVLHQTDEEFSHEWTIPVTDRRTEFVCASIRILGSWLAEETSSMKEEVCAVLPFIITVCSRMYDERKQGTIRDMPDPLRFMLPAFCHLAAEDAPRKIMLCQKLPQLLYDYLLYQWSIFSKWLALQPTVAADWLHVHTTPEEEDVAEANRPESESAIILVCGVFMNLAVLEPELVATDVVFAQLLKFCITNLQPLVHRQDFIVLLGNVSVLGLLLLRHHTWKYAQGDSAAFRYIQGTVSFLWDAHNSEESCDSLSLVISLRYKRDWPDLAELWFLGMQGLSNVMSKLDWIVEFIVDSGWPQEMMKSLSRIVAGAIDANTRTAYEDFLCCLLRAQPAKVRAVILENRGQEVYEVWKKLRYTYMTLDGPAANLLSALRKHNYTIGLITNGPSRSQWEKIAQIGAEDYFDSILLAKENEFYPPIDPPDDPDWKKDLVVSKFTKVCMIFIQAVRVEGEDSIFTLPEYEIIIEDEKIEEKASKLSSSDETELKEFEKILKAKNPTFQDDETLSESLEESVADVQEDKIFLKFKEKIDSYPDQVLRYGKGETPLWVSDSNAPSMIPNCEYCGSERRFEFQIMPQVLNYLQLDNISEGGVDWGTLLIYVCKNNCDSSPSYKNEFLWKQDFSGQNSI
uniref:EOG090X0266 n=1 Tax=Daphnia similis TaxID=35528 RepID=A0A4Y7LRT1_9CRUS|nr:EOG090X0266 [Daphnia similis]SVE70909.1 EOG090X0266 [Daphnia similis]